MARQYSPIATIQTPQGDIDAVYGVPVSELPNPLMAPVAAAPEPSASVPVTNPLVAPVDEALNPVLGSPVPVTTPTLQMPQQEAPATPLRTPNGDGTFTVNVRPYAAQRGYGGLSQASQQEMADAITDQLVQEIGPDAAGAPPNRDTIAAGVLRQLKDVDGNLLGKSREWGATGFLGDVAGALVRTGTGLAKIPAAVRDIGEAGLTAALGGLGVDEATARSISSVVSRVNPVALPINSVLDNGGRELISEADDLADRMTSQVTADERKRVGELINAGRWEDLPGMIASVPGIWNTVLELVPSLAGGTLLARGLGAGAEAATLGQRAAAIGASQGLLQGAQTAEQLATDEQGPQGALTGSEALTALGSGAFTGVTSGVAGRFAPTLERVVLDRVSGAAANAAAPTTIQGLRSYLQSIAAGAGAEGLTNGAQGFVDQYLQGGIDANGNFDAALADRNAQQALAAGAYGATQGAVAGGAGGVVNVRSQNQAVRQQQAAEAEAQAQAEAEARAAALAAQPMGGPVNVQDFQTRDAQDAAKTLAQLQRQMVQTGGGDAALTTAARLQINNAIQALQAQTPTPDSPAAQDLARMQALLETVPLPPVTPAVEDSGQLRFGNVPEGGIDPALANELIQSDAVPTVNPLQGRLQFDEPGTLEPSGQIRLPGVEEGGIDPALAAQTEANSQAESGTPLEVAENQLRLALRARPEDMIYQDALSGQFGLPGFGRAARLPAAETAPADPVDPLRATEPRNELQNTLELGDAQGDIFNPEIMVDPLLSQEQRRRQAIEREAAERVATERMQREAEEARRRNESQSQGSMFDDRGRPTDAALDRGTVNVANVQAVVEATGLPPRAMFDDAAWIAARNKQSAATLRQIAQLDGSEQTTTPRELAVRELKAIYDRGKRLKPESTAPTAVDSRRAKAILDAMQAAEAARPLAEGEQGVADLLSAGKLPAGDDVSLRYDPSLSQFMRDGNVAGALAHAAEQNSSNKLLSALALMASNPEFGVQVEIVRTPIDVRGELVEAAYDPARNVMQFTEQAAGTPYYVAHETVHALTQWALDNPDGLLEAQRNALNVLDAMYQEARSVEGMPDYAKSSLPEFIAEAWSNPTVQSRMTYQSRVPGLGRIREAMRAFTDTIRRLLRLPATEESALSDLAAATQLLTRHAAARLRVDPAADAGFVDRPRTFMPELAHLFNRVVDEQGQGSQQMVGSVFQQGPEDFVMRFFDGRPDVYFDTMADAARYAVEELGYNVNQFATETVGAPANAKLANTDEALTPVTRRLSQAIRSGLGLVDKVGNPTLTRWLNTVAAGTVDAARWLKTVNVNKYAVLQEIDRVLGLDGSNESIVGAFRENEAVRRAATSRSLGFMQQLQTTIVEGLRKANSNERRFGDYMYARHVPERNAKYADSQVVGTVDSVKGDYTGFEYNGLVGNEAARAMMDSLTPQERKTFEILARRLDESRQEILRLELDNGLIDRNTYYRLGGLDASGQPVPGAYQYYVPLLTRGAIDNAISAVGITGRWTKAENPTNSLLLQLDQRLSRVQRAKSLQTLLEALERTPLPDLVKIRQADLQRNRDGEIVKINDLDTLRDKSVYVPRNGQFVRLEINTKTRQGQLLLESLKNDKDYGTGLRVMAAATGWLASMNTGLNPAFVLKTLAWDTWMTLANFQGAYDPTIPTPKAFELSMKTLVNAAKMVGPSLQATRTHKSDDPMYRLYQEAGGGVNPGAMANIDVITERMSRTDPLNVMSAVRNPLNTANRVRENIQHYLHTSDDAIRSAGFKTYIEYRAGREFNGPQDAAALRRFVEENPDVLRRAVLGSKEQTGDFEMRGTGRLMPSLYAFFNAGMQGTRLLASLASNPQGQLSLLTTLALGAIAAASAIDNPEDKDADGGSKYARSDSREQGMLLDANSGFQIPVPYELRPAFVFGNSAVLAMTGKITPAEFARDMAIATRDVYVPMSPPGGDDLAFQLIYASTPTTLQTLFPLALGKDAFGRDTEPQFVSGPDGKRINNPANYERYKPSTSNLARNITEGLYRATDGFVDMYPARLDTAFGAVTGGIGRLITQSVQPPRADRDPIGFGDSGFSQAMTAAYKHKDNPFALGEEYEATAKEYEVELRQLERDAQRGGGNMLMSNPKLEGVREIRAAVDKAVRGLKVQGQSRSELFQAMEAAQVAGDAAAQQEAQGLLKQWYDERDAIYGQALTRIQELTQDD